MKVTAEISLYPLQNNYSDHIKNLLHQLQKHNGISVYTNAMSTYVKGEWQDVMSILTQELGAAFEEMEISCTVIKVINKDVPVEEGYY